MPPLDLTLGELAQSYLISATFGFPRIRLVCESFFLPFCYEIGCGVIVIHAISHNCYASWICWNLATEKLLTRKIPQFLQAYRVVYKLIEEPFFDSNPCIVHSSSVLLLSAKRPSSLWQELVASSRAWLQHGVAACAMVTCCAEIFIVLAAVVVIYIATRSVGVLLRDLVSLRRHGVKSGGFRAS